MAKPTVPKGTRDFLPLEMRRRNHIFNTIKTVFEKYGYAPIETPAMENLSTLTGKYGEEGDRLIFKVLDSGDFTKDLLRDLSLMQIQPSESIVLIHQSFIEEIFRVLPRLLFKLVSQKVDSEEAKVIIRKELYGHSYPEFDLGSDINKFVLDAIWRYDVFLVIEDLFEKIHIPESLVKEFSDPDSLEPIDESLVLSDYDLACKRYNKEELVENPIRGEEWVRIVCSLNYRAQSLIGKVDAGYLPAIDTLRSAVAQKYISEKALRYDLTVPFARYVVNHFNDLSFPFKRYQIQPVWRADRPQKGRYREFYQCDADVVGSDSLLNEVEMIQLFDEVLSTLGLEDFTIKINNRKILSGIAEVAGVAEQITNVTVALDKLDKIGADGVKKEWRDRGIPESAMKTLEPLLAMQGGNNELLTALDKMLANSETGRKGIAELREVLAHIAALGLNKARLQVDVTLARGLDYYTGAIFEVLAGGVQMGSICGGGRYDDLTSIFGMDNLSGVGISFGADRIYDVLLELGKFPEEVAVGTKVLFVNFGEKESRFALKQIKALRAAGISCELYPDNAKMKKQMKFANDKNVQYVALAGENEIAAGKVNLKNMESGEQQEVETHNLINHFK